MKREIWLTSLLVGSLITASMAQSNQAPVMQQSTSTEDRRQANPPKPMLENSNGRQQPALNMDQDTTRPKKQPRKQRRLRPDSLRRGGATRIDTIR
jgi:hypothetical protein